MTMVVSLFLEFRHIEQEAVRPSPESEGSLPAFQPRLRIEAMRVRLSLRSLMAIVAGCALLLVVARSDWPTEWGGYLLLAAVVGLAVGGVLGWASALLMRLIGWGVRRCGLGFDRGEPGAAPLRRKRLVAWFARRYARWPLVVKQAAWSSCVAFFLIVLLDLSSQGAWWNQGAPGQIGWWAYLLISAGLIFSLSIGWTLFAPSPAKEDLDRMARGWLHGRTMANSCAACGSAFRWLMVTSPAWFRVGLAWVLAELAVPGAHLFVRHDREVSASLDVTRFLVLLVGWLLICLWIVTRALYDMGRTARFPRPAAALLAVTLSSIHVWAFFGIGLWL